MQQKHYKQLHTEEYSNEYSAHEQQLIYMKQFSLWLLERLLVAISKVLHTIVCSYCV